MRVEINKLTENDLMVMLLQLKQQVRTRKTYQEVEAEETSYLKQYKPIPVIEVRSYLSAEEPTQEQVAALDNLTDKLDSIFSSFDDEIDDLLKDEDELTIEINQVETNVDFTELKGYEEDQDFDFTGDWDTSDIPADLLPLEDEEELDKSVTSYNNRVTAVNVAPQQRPAMVTQPQARINVAETLEDLLNEVDTLDTLAEPEEPEGVLTIQDVVQYEDTTSETQVLTVTEEDAEEDITYDLTEEDEDEEDEETFDLTEEDEDEDEETFDLTEDDEDEETFDFTEEDDEDEDEETFDLTEDEEDDETFDLTEEEDEDEDEETFDLTEDEEDEDEETFDFTEEDEDEDEEVLYPQPEEQVQQEQTHYTKPNTQPGKMQATRSKNAPLDLSSSRGDVGQQPIQAAKPPTRQQSKAQQVVPKRVSSKCVEPSYKPKSDVVDPVYRQVENNFVTEGNTGESSKAHSSSTQSVKSPRQIQAIPKPPINAGTRLSPIDRLKNDYKYNPASVPRDAKSLVSRYRGIKFFELADTFIPKKELQRAIDRGDIIRKNDRLW